MTEWSNPMDDVGLVLRRPQRVGGAQAGGGGHRAPNHTGVGPIPLPAPHPRVGLETDGVAGLHELMYRPPFLGHGDGQQVEAPGEPEAGPLGDGMLSAS